MKDVVEVASGASSLRACIRLSPAEPHGQHPAAKLPAVPRAPHVLKGEGAAAPGELVRRQRARPHPHGRLELGLPGSGAHPGAHHLPTADQGLLLCGSTQRVKLS